MMDTDVKQLLDKLYDYRRDDSIIITSIDEETENTVLFRDKCKEEIKILKSKIAYFTDEGKRIATEGENLKVALSKIYSEKFSYVLKTLDIDFDPVMIGNNLDDRLPSYLERVYRDKETKEKNLKYVEEQLEKANIKVNELNMRRSEIVSNQSRLNHYFDLAFSSKLNATREEITSLLASFDLDEDEQRLGAKLLMFPEDGLFEYENNSKDKPKATKTISEIIHDAKDTNFEEQKTDIVKVEPVLFNEKEDSVININNLLIKEPAEPKKVELIAPAKVEPIAIPSTTKTTKEELIELFDQEGIDYLDFTSNDFEKMISIYNKETFKNNIEYIASINIESDIFADNIELLVDKDLKNKVELLQDNGKTTKDIYLNSNILSKYTLDELKNAISLLKNNGLDPKTVPLMAY